MKETAIQHLDALVTRLPELEALKPDILKAAEAISNCHRSNGKILICGNGGSAADSEHIVGELMKGFVLPRRLPQSEVDKIKSSGAEDWSELASSLQQGIPAVAITGHVSLSTAILNDNDPYMAFAQQVYVLGRPGDVLIGLSTSGNSRNVVNALKIGRAFGLYTVGLTGERESLCCDVCDVTLRVPAVETYRVQEYHLPVYHCICLMVEEEIFGS